MSRISISREDRARRAAAARDGRNRAAGQGHPTTAEIDYSRDDLEFMAAIQAWKARMGRQFPTWREVLVVVKGLGYAKPFDPAAAARMPQETTRPTEEENPWRAAKIAG